MKPPLRTDADVAALIEGLRDGTIDVIASDHAPHHNDEKEVEFESAAHGIVGLETTLPLALALTRSAGLPIETIVCALTVNPARILGVPGGTLAAGEPADITVIDPNRSWSVQSEALRSKSRNTPFAGWQMTGAAHATLVGGRMVWRQAGEPSKPAKWRGKRSRRR